MPSWEQHSTDESQKAFQMVFRLVRFRGSKQTNSSLGKAMPCHYVVYFLIGCLNKPLQKVVSLFAEQKTGDPVVVARFAIVSVTLTAR